jgi:hypothetical protein
MIALVFLALTAQAACTAEARALVAEAATASQQPDLAAAVTALRTASRSGCADGAIGALYIQGLIDAAAAFRLGAPAQSLEPVHQAIAALDAIAAGRPGPAEIARLVLHAAAAAAQSERDEMALYLEHAERMEGVLRATGQAAAPVLPVAEVAGELWLQVHRYDDAHAAFTRAEAHAGKTPRVAAGLARAAARR